MAILEVFRNTRRCSHAIILLMVIALAGSACKSSRHNRNQVQQPFLDWNVMFKKGSGKEDRRQALEEVKRSATDRANRFLDSIPDKRYRDRYKFILVEDSCSCDTLLYNVKGIIIDPSGTAKTSSSGQPPPTVSGDVVEEIAKNNPLDPGDTKDRALRNSRYPLPGNDVNQDLIIAIIDTGIDTTRFDGRIQDILWRDLEGSVDHTIRNFIPGQAASDFRDQHPIRHGSAVAAMILLQFNHAYPRLMVLKALDDNGQGTVYSVSCALRYASIHHASLINTSLGYYGDPDPILKKYIIGMESVSVPVITAAGNMNPRSEGESCDNRVNTSNQLGGSHLFFPACYNLPNMISVTGYSQLNMPCYFQNFSKDFVTVGVLNDPPRNCCSYMLPFINGRIEGSSFATPIVTGKLGNKMLETGITPVIMPVLNSISANPAMTAPFFTIDGRYIHF
jgi:hypothetical protein